MAIVSIVLGIGLFLIWVTGHWLGAVVALLGVVALCSDGSAIWPNALILFVLAPAPYLIRRFLLRPRLPDQGWGVELRAFRKRQ
jgi:hypothetical protein